MVPPDAVVPGKHGSFGSPPIRLSRDFPSLSDLCGTSIRDRIRAGTADEAGGDRGFVQGEFLAWWMRDFKIPVLATTNTLGGFGFLGEPGTVPILGPGTFLGSSRLGVRVRAGLWLDDCGNCAIDGSVFVLGRKTADAAFGSSQFSVITRPIFAPNVQPGVGPVGQTGEAVAVPNILTGSLTAHAESFLWGADANVRHCLCSGCDWQATWFAGYRFLSLSESLAVTENITVVGPGGTQVRLVDPVGTVVTVRDRFGTENRFNGGQIGATYERRWGRFDVSARGSVALGVTHQELDIFGSQTRVRPGQLPVTFSGGLLAAGPNLGTFTRDRFSVAPEFTLNLGYWVTPNFKAYVGYNFLYWSNVLRPGDQIDRVVDLTFVPNAPPVPFSGQFRPQPLLRQSDLWVTGLQAGIEWRW
jgi:Putative beta barrel porin-7 (BBP7)